MMGFGTILPSSCRSSRAQAAVDAEVAFDLSRPSAWCATDAVTGSHFAQCVARAPMARSRPMTSTRGAAFEGRGTTCCHPSGYEDLGEANCHDQGATLAFVAEQQQLESWGFAPLESLEGRGAIHLPIGPMSG